MASHKPLSPEFSWHEEANRLVLRLQEIPLAQVEPTGNAWVVRTLMHDGEPPSRIAVPSAEEGKAWVMRWAHCRQGALVRAIAQRLTAHRLANLQTG